MTAGRPLRGAASGQDGGRDGRRSYLRIRRGPACGDIDRRHDRRLLSVRHELFGLNRDPHHQRGQGRQPLGLRRDVKATGDDRMGVGRETSSAQDKGARKSKRRRLNSAIGVKKQQKLSRTHAPADLSPIEWQRGLRRQFGREQTFGLENLTSEPFYSEFRVSNPVSKSSYRVAVRGLGPGGNFCSCPDYATSELGTCKHLEFTLARLERKRGARAAFARGYQPAFSELYLRNDGKRCVHFRAGTDCPPAVREAAAGLFDAEHNGMLPQERLGELEPFMTMVSKCGHELRAYDDAVDFVAGRRDADRRASMLTQLFPRDAADPKLRALLKVPLYPYQAEGALFAVRVGRALIAEPEAKAVVFSQWTRTHDI